MTLPDEFAAPASAKSPAREENDGNSPSIKNEEPGVSEKKGHSLWTRRDRPVSSKFEPLRSLPSLLVFLADMILPVDQRSIYALPLLYLHGGFSAPIYKRSWVLIIILWLLPELSLPVLYSGCILYDQYWREKLNRLVDHWGSDRFSFTNYVCHLIMLYAILYIFGPETIIQPVIVTLECLFGPVKSWYRVILSTQTILLIPHRRGRLNASVAEGKEGILLALLCHACCAVLSCPLQWACYLVWSIPDFAHPLMFAQWIVSSASWFYLEVPPVVAYLALLWLNQYPHADISFEKWSGGPSSILRRERSGTLWLGTTTLLLRICDIYFTQAVGGHLALLILLIVLAKWPEILLRRPYFRRLMTPWIVLPIKRFSYEPICEDDEFRLLRLLPQARNDGVPIQCEMIHETLKSAPPYTAISYHWGNPSPEEMIEIFINGSSFKVSPTVHSLLLAERGPKKSTVVWIDSICIKQSDNFEKTRQVCLLMRPIFQRAERVIGWLGENNNSKSALAFIRDLHRSARPEHSNTEFGRIYRLAVDELEVLLRNPWFERAWIIQEVAVSENLVLRHGDEEVTWRQLAKIIFLIFAIDSDMVDPFQEKLCHNTGALNVLLLDNIRRQVEERNPLKLKDLVRLGLRFKATLPRDKVYALMGIAKEKQSSFLRPNLSRTGTLGVVVDESVPQAVESYMAAWNKNFGSNSITQWLGSEMLDVLVDRATPERAVRTLTRMRGELLSGRYGGDPSHTTHFGSSQATLGTANMRDNHVKHNVLVDYSKNSTVEEIYVYVAKDFIKEGDFASLFRLAGIGQARSEDMKHLPSWVPDWSGSLERYSLPRRSTSFVSPRETNSNNSNGSLWISHEGGSEFLFVTGILVGRLEHLSRLTTQFSDKDSDIEDTQIIDARMQQFWNPTGSEVSYGDISIFFEEVKADILAQQSRFNSALQSVLSHQVVQRRYNMTNAEQAKNALVRTCMANTAPNGSTAATDDIRWYEERWVGMSCQGPVGAALWLPDNQIAVELDSASKLQIRKGVCKGYMLQRQGQVGSNSISAQFVRSEILPSFASYGYRSGLEMRGIWPPDLEESFAQTEESKRLQKAENMFTDAEGGPLAVFTASVDYTFGRMLAITDSGFLGLVPDKAEKGDLLIWLEHDHMFLLLRPSESELRAQKAGDSSERQCRGDEGKSSEDEVQSVRFVGESYVHEFVSMKKSTESFEQKRFKLW